MYLSSVFERDHLEDVSVNGSIILEWALEKQGGKVWTGCNRLSTGTSDRLL
jgi:hypothetical protein